MIQIMIDIETLGRKNDASIREVGLVAFTQDGDIKETLQLSVSPEVWNTHSRTFSGETVLWLLSKGSVDSNFNCENYEVLTDRIDGFFKKHNGSDTRVWSKGHMDLEVLKDLYEELGKPLPWSFWQPRDMRTLMDFCTVSSETPIEPTHKAVDDAIVQTNVLCKMMQKLSDMS